MNKTKNITKDNIDETEQLIKTIVLFCLLKKEGSRKIKNIRMGKEMIQYIHVKYNL